MTSTALLHMQAALDLAPQSPHPANKIAATLFGLGEDNEELSITRTNHWPKSIEDKIGRDTKIGNSSGTIHAETDCILNASFGTEHASLCITDPFCPNCAKNIAEAGIKNIYIDRDGFDKDFFSRRGDHFDTMSMQICQRAGINVYSIDMTTKEIKPILEIPKEYKPVEDSPIITEPVTGLHEKTFHKTIKTAAARNQRRKYAVAMVEDLKGQKFALTARAHAVVGYTMQKPDEALDLLTPIGKYSFIQEPVNRMMMHISRMGYKLLEDYLYCSQVPTAREQVNLVGANIKRITIGDIQRCRDPKGLKAMEQLSAAKILNYS